MLIGKKVKKLNLYNGDALNRDGLFFNRDSKVKKKLKISGN